MPTSSLTRRLALPATLGALVLLGACSSNGTPTPTSTTAPTTPATSGPGGSAADRSGGTTPGTVAPPGTSTTTGARASSTTASTPTSSGPTSSVSVLPANQPFCDRLAQAGQEFANLDVENGGDQVLVRLKQTFTELVALAPPEIKADVETADKAVQSATSTADLAKLDTPELTQVNGRMDTWTHANCGNGVSSSTTGGGTP